jgi:hypothetical protein
MLLGSKQQFVFVEPISLETNVKEKEMRTYQNFI